MTISKSKIKISTITLVLFLSISGIISILPAVVAHDPAWTIPTYAYVSLAPRTVGVGQYTLVVMWLDWVPPTAGGLGGDRWNNFMIEVTKPDGSTQQLGPFTSGPVGTTWTTYTPDQAGDYTFVLDFPGQTATNGTGTPNYRGTAYVGDYFEPSTSAPATLHVTQEALEGWTEPPLPEYVTRPINDANREWSQLASNWLGGSWLVDGFQRAGTAPNTGHIIWTKQLTLGGIADAAWPGQPNNIHNYESPWSTPIIMQGIIYYNEPRVGTKVQYGYNAIDLYTGELIFHKNGTDNGIGPLVRYVGYASGANSAPELHQSYAGLSFGQLYHYSSVNGQGIAPCLWMTSGSSWYMLDADNGNWIMTLEHVPGGTTITDQDGSIIRYNYNSRTGQLLAWNTSQSIPPSGPTGTAQQIWKPRLGATIDAVNDSSWTVFGPRLSTYSFYGIERLEWDEIDILPRSGYTMNLTTQAGLLGISRVVQDENRVPKILLGFAIDPPIATSGLAENTETFRMTAIRIDEGVAPFSPYPDRTFTQNTNLGYGATVLYDKNYTNPKPGTALSLESVSYEDDLVIVSTKQTMQMYGYSLSTGALKWGPTEPQDAWDMYGITTRIAYGKIYSAGYGGIIYCYDAATGNLLWTYTASEIGYESPYGNYPLNFGFIADGKLYMYSTEHSPTKPLWRGSYIRCIDTNTGDELWRLLDFNQGMAIADGYIVTADNYNNLIYCIGKGPSATTVTGPDTAVPHGTPVVLQGRVTDVSPGTNDPIVKGHFPNGVPAISDEDQSAWMEYVYMQQACPGNAEGVEVTLDTIDPNGNFIHIGTVTTDMSGMFKKMWTPDIEGEYTIIATFEGSESYASSYGETALGVSPAVTPSGPIEPEEPTAAPLISTELAIVLAVVVVVVIGVVAFWALRKRK